MSNTINVESLVRKELITFNPIPNENCFVTLYEKNYTATVERYYLFDNPYSPLNSGSMKVEVTDEMISKLNRHLSKEFFIFREAEDSPAICIGRGVLINPINKVKNFMADHVLGDLHPEAYLVDKLNRCKKDLDYQQFVDHFYPLLIHLYLHRFNKEEGVILLESLTEYFWLQGRKILVNTLMHFINRFKEEKFLDLSELKDVELDYVRDRVGTAYQLKLSPKAK